MTVDPVGQPAADRGWAVPRIVLVSVALSTLLSLLLAFFTIGTNDVPGFLRFAEEVRAGGLAWLYVADWEFNHPPLIALYVWAVGTVTGWAPEWFPFVFKLLSIAANVAMPVVMFRLVRHFYDERTATAISVVTALSPVLILVAGFHGNTDPAFLLFMMLALERLLIARKPVVAGLVLGFACSIKIVPIVCIPAIFFWLPTWRRRIEFFGAMGVLLVAGYGLHATVVLGPMVKNILGWGGVPGQWGYSRFYAGSHDWAALVLFKERMKRVMQLFLVVSIGIRQWSRRGEADDLTRGRTLLEAIGWTFLLFMILAPGFGVQYLSWLVPTTLFLGLRWWAVYQALAGIFLGAVYTYWCGGFPWFYADSLQRGVWRGPSASLGTILWLFLIVWALLRFLREADQGPARAPVVAA